MNVAIKKREGGACSLDADGVGAAGAGGGWIAGRKLSTPAPSDESCGVIFKRPIIS